MRRPLHLLFILLAFAGAAEAQQAARAPASRTAPPGLRGSVAPEDRNTATATAGASLRTGVREPVNYGARSVAQPLTAAAPGAGDVAQQCRLSCAQTYYFCLASPQADDCPTSWGQCRAGCSADPLTSSY